MRGRTWGSETSQYPEEQKAIYGTFFLDGCRAPFKVFKSVQSSLIIKYFIYLYLIIYGCVVLSILKGARRHYVQEEGSCDSLSSGERNGNSPNRTYLYVRGCRTKSAFSCEKLQIRYIKESVGKRYPRG